MARSGNQPFIATDALRHVGHRLAPLPRRGKAPLEFDVADVGPHPHDPIPRRLRPEYSPAIDDDMDGAGVGDPRPLDSVEPAATARPGDDPAAFSDRQFDGHFGRHLRGGLLRDHHPVGDHLHDPEWLARHGPHPHGHAVVRPPGDRIARRVTVNVEKQQRAGGRERPPAADAIDPFFVAEVAVDPHVGPGDACHPRRMIAAVGERDPQSAV